MKWVSHFLSKAKDDGKESPVDAYFLIECKGLFSIALLKFNKGKREEFHTHAFDAMTWFLSGDLEEEDVSGELYQYKRSWKPKKTLKGKDHRVKAYKDSWCLTVRGKWSDKWTEYNKDKDTTTVLTHGRKIVSTTKGYNNIFEVA